MASATELTYQEVSGHSSKKDLYVVIHDKVYNCTNFIDEHPGGEEVMLDLAGTDATEAFEDVGHSDEAREILDTLFTANIKRVPGDQAPKVHQSAPEPVAKPSSGMSTVLYAIVITGGIAAAFLYTYLQEQKNIVMPEEA